MRFARLSLERYGRFEGCELEFRPGSPDLHIVYGANEAGKTTSLAAVEDLLFGFPTRSPYNFLFDYSLLRVGAVLQAEGRELICRRKKGTTGTLLGPGDVVIDDAMLRGMLMGQTRETFSLSFSLDQEALRAGGRAMVEAQNDLGRTLFAAGSGLTGVSDHLKAIEAEADAIWGPTTRGSRSFTQSQHQLVAAARALKDGALRPKAWVDARTAADDARAAMETARQSRAEAQAELGAVERARRMAPLARRRLEQMDALQAFDGTIDLGRQREDAIQRLIDEAEVALREMAAAKQMRVELVARRETVVADPAAIADAELIDQLVVDAGAVSKAEKDLVHRRSEHATAIALVDRLRMQAGVNADVTPEKAIAARLREIARRHGELAVAARQIAESQEGIDLRRERAEAKFAGMPPENAADELVAAVDAARALGSDADERCAALRRRSLEAAASVAEAVGRLAPWRGSVAELASLPVIGVSELDGARVALAEAGTEVRREEDMARRFADQLEAVGLNIERVATGAAVSADDVAAVRADRERLWYPLRAHILDGAPVEAPTAAVRDFEMGVAAADERMDVRFALADASSRLAILEQARAAHALDVKQAEHRAQFARRRLGDLNKLWSDRLTSIGLPDLDPTAFESWQAGRVAADEANERFLNIQAETDRTDLRLHAVRAALSSALGTDGQEEYLAPILARAERRRATIEEATQQRRLIRSELDQFDADSMALDRRRQRLHSDVVATEEAWAAAIAQAGVVMDVASCDGVLGTLDELREAVAVEADLRRRIDGIVRDERKHASEVDEVAGRLSVESGTKAARLAALKGRLTTARSAAAVLRGLEEDDRRFGGRIEEARVKLAAAEGALADVLIETGSSDRQRLAIAVERSNAMRSVREEIASLEVRMVEDGDGLPVDQLVVAALAVEPTQVGKVAAELQSRLQELNERVDEAAAAHGGARRAFEALDTQTTSAADAAADAEHARAELEVLAEHYILKRAEAVTLKWAMERYRERHQDPMLLRAGELFSRLTTGNYASLRVDADGTSPRLLGLRDDRRTMVEVGAMSEGTTDQLFLALRLAALEQSVEAGVRLPFLADDLFVNFDDERARAGFEVLAEVAKSTQVLFFTHHPHLVALAKSVVGADLHSECALG